MNSAAVADELSGGSASVSSLRARLRRSAGRACGRTVRSLDPITRAERIGVRRIQQRVRKTVVLVTHDMREAFALADRVGVLDEGMLVAYDEPSVLRASSQPAVALLLESCQ